MVAEKAAQKKPLPGVVAAEPAHSCSGDVGGTNSGWGEGIGIVEVGGSAFKAYH